MTMNDLTGADFTSVPFSAPVPVLAVGGDIKSSVCLMAGARAAVEEIPGGLSDPAMFRAFLRAVDRTARVMDAAPERVACDMHPQYLSTRHARGLGLPVTEVQHHHAHIMSCLVDNGVIQPVIGICCDGTGFGTDGAVWGCEVLVCGGAAFTRAGHLGYFSLPGGDAAALDTWRPAAGLLHETYGPGWPDIAAPLLTSVDAEAVRVTAQRLAGPAALVRTSSLGRLFDGVAFLLGLCDRNRTEGEAPMAVEAAGEAWAGAVDPLPYSLGEDPATGALRMDVHPMIRALVEGRGSGRSVSELARAFHETVAAALAACVARTAAETGIRTAALSGGCFFNRILSRRLVALLQEKKLDILMHRRLSPGDGGIALGQAAVAALEAKGGESDVSCCSR